MERTFIYTLTDPETLQVRYVGKANEPKRRFERQHLYDIKKTHKSNWIQSLRKKGLKPTLEVIDQVNLEEWKFWETHYISLYKSWGFNLTNGTSGGEGFTSGSEHHEKAKRLSAKVKRDRGYWHSEETKNKMRIANTDHLQKLSKDPEVKELNYRATRGRKQSEEERAMRSKAQQNISEEDKVKRANKAIETHKGKITSEATKQKMREKALLRNKKP